MSDRMTEHLTAIELAIDEAEKDGYVVGIVNDCCGCSKISLEIGPDDSSLGTDTAVIILGERQL